MLAKLKDGSEKLGFLDLNTEIALFSINGSTEKFEGGATANFMTIFRNLKPPPTGLKVYRSFRSSISFICRSTTTSGTICATETRSRPTQCLLTTVHSTRKPDRTCSTWPCGTSTETQSSEELTPTSPARQMRTSERTTRRTLDRRSDRCSC